MAKAPLYWRAARAGEPQEVAAKAITSQSLMPRTWHCQGVPWPSRNRSIGSVSKMSFQSPVQWVWVIEHDIRAQVFRAANRHEIANDSLPLLSGWAATFEEAKQALEATWFVLQMVFLP